MLLQLLTVLAILHQGIGCYFPDFLQSIGKGREHRAWQGHIVRPVRDTSRSYTLLIGFNGQAMTCQVTGGQQLIDRPRPYVRECLDEVKPGRYLVAHRETDTITRKEKFTCMQFFWRSDHVVEIKESKLQDVMEESLCDQERLILNEWPLLNRKMLQQHVETPPLLGGYSLMVFDKSTQTELCPAYENQLRLESECIEGDGMVFHFRDKRCVPKHLHMKPTQTVYCFGSWFDGDFQFLILRHSRLDHQWCFRMPRERKNSFVSYLYKDVHCSRQSSQTIQNTHEYVRIHMRRDSPRSLESLCYDEHENCAYKPGICSDRTSKDILMCAKTCGICNDNTPSMCYLPSKLRGKWYDSKRSGHDIIEVKQKKLLVKDYQKFQCVNWTVQHHEEYDAFSQMFVITSKNGCKPRYACAEFHLKSPALLRYRLSQNLVWPFPGTDPLSIGCKPFEPWYKNDKAPLNDRIHSRHHKVLISGNSYKVMACKLGHNRVFNVSFPDGKQCTGSLEEVGYPVKTHLYLVLNETCSNLAPEKEHECVDSSKHGYLSDLMIISRKIPNRQDMNCWMFPLTTPQTFYLLNVSDCYSGAVDKIKAGTIKPLATFHEIPQLQIGSSLNPLFGNTTFGPRTGGGGKRSGNDGKEGEGVNPGGEGVNPGGKLPGTAKQGPAAGKGSHCCVSSLLPQLLCLCISAGKYLKTQLF